MIFIIVDTGYETTFCWPGDDDYLEYLGHFEKPFVNKTKVYTCGSWVLQIVIVP